METDENVKQEIVEAVKRKRPDKAEQMQVHMEKGENARYIRHALATYNLPPIDISDINQVTERIDWYFAHCMDDDMKPTVSGLRNSLGISKDTFANWLNGTYRGDSHCEPIKKAKDFLEELMEDYMLNGRINPVAGIFVLKNNFNWSDKNELVITPNAQPEDYDAEAIRQRYMLDSGDVIQE